MSSRGTGFGIPRRSLFVSPGFIARSPGAIGCPTAAPSAVANQPAVSRGSTRSPCCLSHRLGAAIGVTYGYDMPHWGGAHSPIDVDGSFWDAIWGISPRIRLSISTASLVRSDWYPRTLRSSLERTGRCLALSDTRAPRSSGSASSLPFVTRTGRRDQVGSGLGPSSTRRVRQIAPHAERTERSGWVLAPGWDRQSGARPR